MKFLLFTLTMSISAGAFAVSAANGNSASQSVQSEASAKQSESSALKNLISSEMSAVDSYDSALKTVEDKNVASSLTKIRDNHKSALDTLKGFMGNSSEVEAKKKEGAWGTLSSLTGSGGSIGKAVALRSLLSGEKESLSDYMSVLKDENVSGALKGIIKDKLLPQQKGHLDMIQSFL